jgi:hypothetical protein
MQVRSGKLIDIWNPTVEVVDIVDIAHSLANQCRYFGHTVKFYSVAEHCVLLAPFARPTLRKSALMHDAAETYVGDIVRAVKHGLEPHMALEKLWEGVIAEKFDLLYPWDAEIKTLDNRILLDEMVQAMAPPQTPWTDLKGPPLGVKIRFWEPEQAEQQFLTAFHDYSIRGA